jgi:hypothetical protein
MHPSPLLPAFAIGLALMLVSLAVNVFPHIGSSAQVRNKGLIRAAVINAVIIVCVVVYIMRHQ